MKSTGVFNWANWMQDKVSDLKGSWVILCNQWAESNKSSGALIVQTLFMEVSGLRSTHILGVHLRRRVWAAQHQPRRRAHDPVTTSLGLGRRHDLLLGGVEHDGRDPQSGVHGHSLCVWHRHLERRSLHEWWSIAPLVSTVASNVAALMLMRVIKLLII